MDEVGDISEQLQHDIELYDEALTRAWDGVPASMLAGLNDSFGALPSSGTKATNESIVEWRRTLWGEDNALPVGCSYTVNVGHGGITLASPFEKVFEYELQLGKTTRLPCTATTVSSKRRRSSIERLHTRKIDSSAYIQ